MAAEARGTFQLDATQVTGKAREVGALLMRGWAELNERDLDLIAQIVRRRGKASDRQPAAWVSWPAIEL